MVVGGREDKEVWTLSSAVTGVVKGSNRVAPFRCSQTDSQLSIRTFPAETNSLVGSFVSIVPTASVYTHTHGLLSPIQILYQNGYRVSCESSRGVILTWIATGCMDFVIYFTTVFRCSYLHIKVDVRIAMIQCRKRGQPANK